MLKNNAKTQSAIASNPGPNANFLPQSQCQESQQVGRTRNQDGKLALVFSWLQDIYMRFTLSPHGNPYLIVLLLFQQKVQIVMHIEIEITMSLFFFKLPII